MPKSSEAIKRARDKHYNSNKKAIIAKVSARRQEFAKWLKTIKSELFCATCGENDPVCLDFHHSNKTEKEICVSQAVNRGWSKERILKEIAKCEILCSNCHRKFHSN